MKLFKSPWFYFSLFLIALFFITYLSIKYGTEKLMENYTPPKDIDYTVVN